MLCTVTVARDTFWDIYIKGTSFEKLEGSLDCVRVIKDGEGK